MNEVNSADSRSGHFLVKGVGALTSCERERRDFDAAQIYARGFARLKTKNVKDCRIGADDNFVVRLCRRRKSYHRNDPFTFDYHRLRVGGLILAAVLCLIGITILLSGHCRCKFNQNKRQDI
ncbi:hypothetical protein WMY93_026746 [Mugilogobius chulae]|uniref:FXYD domain-containing ion transport regulator n=1 Tax=Mugilogobius chulae TaxID=88201 RepID=A0AAW0N423_9GOBI